MVKQVKSKINSDKPYLADFIPVLMPTSSGNADVGTVVTLYTAIQSYKRFPLFITSNNKSTVGARTYLFKVLKEANKQYNFKENCIRGFFIDSDIVISSVEIENLVKEMQKADEQNYNFIIPYNFPSGETDILKRDRTKYHTNEKLPEFTQDAGLGFFYGDLVLDYEFYNTNMRSEDVNYLHDNFKLTDVRVNTDIKIYHKKIGYW